MGANSRDLENYYQAELGGSVTLSAGVASARVQLVAGKKYRARFVNPAGGATMAWLLLGGSTVTATTASPSSPLTTADNYTTVEFTARPNRNYLAAILNAGTASIVITPVSR